MEEFLPLVDEAGNVIGKETRKTCHNRTFLLHPVVHLHVFNSKCELFLQKRVETKDVQPGKWDTAVGGHVDFGENVASALLREAFEELGLKDFQYKKLFSYTFRSEVEFELINSFSTIYDGEINFDKSEISDGKFWKISEISAQLGKNIFTPNFEQEFLKLLEVLKNEPQSDI